MSLRDMRRPATDYARREAIRDELVIEQLREILAERRRVQTILLLHDRLTAASALRDSALYTSTEYERIVSIMLAGGHRRVRLTGGRGLGL
jgi:molybdenum cofactor biosynthesis enzyme MoaA